MLTSLNMSQQQAVKTAEGPVLVLAGAGSGKTRALTYRIAYLIKEKNISPYNILAVTFTNKAAREMADRVKDLLASEQFSKLSKIQDNKQIASLSYRFIVNKGQDNIQTMKQRSNATAPLIGTFHSVCARVLRQEIELLGYKRSFTILDAYDQKKAVKLVMDELNINSKDLAPGRILAGIEQAKNKLQNPEIYAQTIDRNSPRQIETALIYEQYQKYLKEMNYLDFGDLLAKTIELWRKFPEILTKYQNKWHYLLVDEYQDTNYAQYMWCKLLSAKLRNIFAVGDDAQAIYGFRGADFRNILNFEQDYPEAKVIFMEQNYRSTKAILNLGNLIIRQNTYQKTKNLWTANQQGPKPKIVEVEDEKAEACFILEVIAKQKLDIDQIDIASRNIPVNQEIYYQLAETNQVSLKHGSGILDKILEQRRDQQKKSSKIAVSSMFNDHVYIREDDYDQEDNSTCRDDSASRLYGSDFQNLPLNNFVVLYRTNAQSRAIEEQLLRFNVPYRIIGGLKFYARKEIKDMLAYLSLLINPYDYLSLERVINVPARGIGDRTLAKLIAFAKNHQLDFLNSCLQIGEKKEFQNIAPRLRSFALPLLKIKDVLFKLKISALIDQLGQAMGYFDWLKNTEENWAERQENIKELKTAALKFDSNRHREANRPAVSSTKAEVNLSAFLQEVALQADIDNLETNVSQALTLMTLHAVKGLEFPYVFIVGAEQGLLPHSNSLSDLYQLEEERRLCYVGITRAKQDLFFIYTRTRNLYGNTLYPQVSEFIKELDGRMAERVYL